MEELTAYLNMHLHPGDSVQALDWTGGPLQSMLMAQAPVAVTRFAYASMLYADVSQPYLQSLRSEFITQFRRSQPRYVLEVYDDSSPWINGPDTTRSFPELQTDLDNQYQVVLQGNGYRIYERRM